MPDTIDSLKQASNAIFAQVAAIYALVVLAVWGVSELEAGLNLPFILGSVSAWAVIGWCQFALFNALHEALHRRFGRPHREALSYLLAAYPLGFDESYRAVHLDHHKYFGDPLQDPDYPNYANFPRSRGAFALRLFLNLCGWYALLQFLGIHQGGATGAPGDGTPVATARRPLLRLALSQLLILAVFALSVGWFYYIWLWLIPLASFAKFFSSTRAFCEHGSPDNEPVIRTITGSYPGEKILGVFCFHYHAEHHRYVGIPYNQLRLAHQQATPALYEAGGKPPGGERYELYQHGYLRLLLDWFRALPG